VVHGFTPRDVAEMHGISESTVRQHVFRARTTLQDRLLDLPSERRKERG
jgi:DNA-directed RNA polymerase specialized sigma24 family protein